MEKSRSMRNWGEGVSRQSKITKPDLVHQRCNKEEFGEFLSDTLSLSKKITGTLMDKFDKGIDIKVILNREEYQKYIEQFKQNLTNPDNADASARYKPLYDSNDSLVKLYEKGHHYFETRYKISSPGDNRLAYSSDVGNRCVVHVAMMLLHDQGIDVSLPNIMKKLEKEGNKNEYDDKKIPSLFKKAKVAYGQIPGDVTIATLREALKSGYAIGVGVRKKKDAPHMLVIDAIDDEYVYIRDSLPTKPEERRYCVTIADFENALPYDAMVPSEYFKHNSDT